MPSRKLTTSATRAQSGAVRGVTHVSRFGVMGGGAARGGGTLGFCGRTVSAAEVHENARAAARNDVLIMASIR